MQRSDSVVLDWLGGKDASSGLVNPAGPLYIQGAEAMEAAMTDPAMAVSRAECVSLHGGTTCSYTGGCLCC